MDNVENVIKQIMRVDKDAYAKKLQNEKQISQKNESFQQASKIFSEDIISTAQDNAQRKYNTEIEIQALEIRDRDKKTIQTIQEIQSRYKEVEERVCEGLFKQMFNMEE